jgi:GNAT superfamily N-acetyltransferase
MDVRVAAKNEWPRLRPLVEEMGFVEDRSHLRNDLFVRRDARLSGVGRSLFRAVRAWATERDASWLQWHGGSESREFYAHLGIEPIVEDPNRPTYEIAFKHPAG